VAQSGDRYTVFTGEYRHSIDAKGRIAVPARFRSDLAGVCYVCNWLDGCLAIFPREAWEQLVGQVGTLGKVGDATARNFARFLFSGAYEAQLDSQGRLLLPPNLREGVGLAADAVVVGLSDRVEIWPPDRWTSYRAGMADPDEFAARLAGLAI
jgi:MraZ protein